MKRGIIFFFSLLITTAGFSQQPVQWSFTVKKITPKTFEVYLIAIIQPGWHIYAQQQPEDAIALPTSIQFVKNPLLSFNGNVKEIGRLEKYKDPTLGIEAYQYADMVDFVQVVNLKSSPKGKASGRSVKTNISGSIEFQVCTDELCLPPAITNFRIVVEG